MARSGYFQRLTAYWDGTSGNSAPIGLGSLVRRANSNASVNYLAPFRLTFPANWSTANITFQISDTAFREDGTMAEPTWGNALKNKNGTISYTGVAAGDVIALDVADFVAIRQMRIVSSVTQPAGVEVAVAATGLTEAEQ